MIPRDLCQHGMYVGRGLFWHSAKTELSDHAKSAVDLRMR